MDNGLMKEVYVNAPDAGIDNLVIEVSGMFEGGVMRFGQKQPKETRDYSGEEAVILLGAGRKVILGEIKNKYLVCSAVKLPHNFNHPTGELARFYAENRDKFPYCLFAVEPINGCRKEDNALMYALRIYHLAVEGGMRPVMVSGSRIVMPQENMAHYGEARQAIDEWGRKIDEAIDILRQNITQRKDGMDDRVEEYYMQFMEAYTRLQMACGNNMHLIRLFYGVSDGAHKLRRAMDASSFSVTEEGGMWVTPRMHKEIEEDEEQLKKELMESGEWVAWEAEQHKPLESTEEETGLTPEERAIREEIGRDYEKEVLMIPQRIETLKETLGITVGREHFLRG